MSATILLSVAALPVLWRVARILAHMSRAHHADAWRFQGFALGYAVLGAVTVDALVTAWAGPGVDWHDATFVAASALLILFDRRVRK